MREFLGETKGIQPSAVVLGEEPEERYPLYVEWDRQRLLCDTESPPSIIDIIARCKESDIPEFSPDQISMLEKATKVQSVNKEWVR